MASDSLDGRWRATGTCSANSQIKIDLSGVPDPNGVADWLNGFDSGLARDARPTSGLILTIETTAGTFTERLTGDPLVEWFDAEGVLTQGVSPFDGTFISNAQGAYLCPQDVPKWAAPVAGRYGEAILRYDDGDTKIADSLRVVEGRLVRTVNVVTDELYLNRVVIIYERDQSA
jgi:hypothetical protein